MMMTVSELKQYMTTDETDQALELSIRQYTNNDFTRILAENNGEWPMDIKMGVADMMRFKLTAGKKAGIASETLSRHSVTYESLTADNTVIGYPKALTAFLKPYIRARFGKGYVG